jgi:NADH-quinone oxidoreductase subunit M
VIGVVLGAAYLLWLYQRVMFGNVTNPANEQLPDLNWREWTTIGTLILFAFWIGIYPKPLFDVLDKPVQQIVMRYDPSYYAPKNASATPALGAAPAIAATAAAAPAQPETK